MFVGWGSLAVQNRFMGKRAAFGIAQWFSRYLKFKELIILCAADTKPIDTKIVKSATGRFVEKHHKKPVPLILFFFLSLYYCLVIGPFLAAVSDPLKNMHNLHILIADFDGGVVGTAFIDWIHTLQNTLTGCNVIQSTICVFFS